MKYVDKIIELLPIFLTIGAALFILAAAHKKNGRNIVKTTKDVVQFLFAVILGYSFLFILTLVFVGVIIILGYIITAE